MDKQKEIVDYWRIIKKLLKNSIGTGDIVSLQRWGNSNAINADIDISSNLLDGTPHKVRKNTKLIHYTSVNALFEIINSKKLRIGNASQMNDPQELSYFLKKFEKYISPEFYEQASNIFLISFCEYKENGIIKNKEHFNMWRNYGDNGNGVGIVFSLANYDLKSKWIHSAIGKVVYDSEGAGYLGLKKFFDELENLKQLNTLTINNLPNIIFQLATLYKAPIWAEEEEIRLFRFLKWEKPQWYYQFNKGDFTKDIKATYRGNIVKYFIELDLDNRSRLEKSEKLANSEESQKLSKPFSKTNYFDIYPALKIEKIIFGYKIPSETKNDICKVIRKLASENLGLSLSFEDSAFTNYFKT